MTNGLELAKRAISLFQQNRGSESLYLQCQRFDGFYTQWAWQGDPYSAINTYATAQTAANVALNNGRIYTKDFNDERITAGERVYYRWDGPGHVCSVIGRDAGGLLVTNTANAGDDLGQLGNHVKISHAHTLGLELIGISSRDGNNPHISDVDMWLPGGGQPAGPTPSGDDRIRLENWAWYTSANDAVAMRNPHGKQWTGESYLNGDYDVLAVEGNGAIRIAAKDGSTVWAHPSARPLIYYTNGGAPAPAPTPNVQWFDVPASGQYYYWQLSNALVGNYAADQILRGGQTLRVVENSGQGPVRVQAADGDLVWVGTRNHPAAIR